MKLFVISVQRCLMEETNLMLMSRKHMKAVKAAKMNSLGQNLDINASTPKQKLLPKTKE